MNRKRVMVTKPEIAGNASTMRCHISNERLRARERRRHHQVRAIKRCQRHIPTASAKALHTRPRMTRPRRRRRAMETLDLRCKDGINTRGARHNHHAGPAQRARWLAEPTRRQQRAIDGGSPGIDKHNIQVASNLSMLKCVIKYRAINTLICCARTRYGCHAIRTNRHGHSRKHRSELFRFIRNPITRAVAAQRNHGMMPGRLQRLNTPANKRRLSRAAH
jgi:hypothetical protein